MSAYYLMNAPRKARDSFIGNMYSNNLLTGNKRAVLQMPNFNRKFLPEEIEQFLHNEMVQSKGRKRYIYNPEIHGEDEAAFKKYFGRMNSGEHRFTLEMLAEIREANAAKEAQGEVVRLVPWNARPNMA